MPRFIVQTKEVHTQEMAIEADDADDAKRKVDDGEGKEMGSSDYSYVLDTEYWDVRPATEEEAASLF